MSQFEERPRKVHLAQDQSGRKQRGRDKPVDNTLCASNHGDRGLLKTDDPSKVTCRRCLHQLGPANNIRRSYMSDNNRTQQPKQDLSSAMGDMVRAWQLIAGSAAEIANAKRVLFLAYVSEGFTEAQALELVKTP